MEDSRRHVAGDALACAATVIVLILVSAWAMVTIQQVRGMAGMYVEMGVQLPAVTRLIFQPAVGLVLRGLVILALLGGFAVLALVRDRLRALVYTLVIAFLTGLLAMALHAVAVLPLFKMIQQLGQ